MSAHLEVHIGVEDLGLEADLWRGQGVLLRYLDQQLEHSASVHGAFWPLTQSISSVSCLLECTSIDVVTAAHPDLRCPVVDVCLIG